MKKLLIILVILIFSAFLYFISLYIERKEYNNQMRKITHIDMYLGSNIEQLDKVKLTICDSVYFYTHNDILDTVCENISISDKKFPCPVKIKYFFKDSTQKEILIDSFDCAGCSGTNVYKLYNNKVEYVYHP